MAFQNHQFVKVHDAQDGNANGVAVVLEGGLNMVGVYTTDASTIDAAAELLLEVSPNGGTTYIQHHLGDFDPQESGLANESGGAETFIKVPGNRVRARHVEGSTSVVTVYIATRPYSMRDAIKVLDLQDVNVAAAAASTHVVPIRGDGKLECLCWAADFDSGSVDLEYSPDGGTTWFNARSAITADLSFTLDIGQIVGNKMHNHGLMYRAVVTSVATPGTPDISLHMWQ